MNSIKINKPQGVRVEYFVLVPDNCTENAECNSVFMKCLDVAFEVHHIKHLFSSVFCRLNQLQKYALVNTLTSMIWLMYLLDIHSLFAQTYFHFSETSIIIWAAHVTNEFKQNSLCNGGCLLWNCWSYFEGHYVSMTHKTSDLSSQFLLCF